MPVNGKFKRGGEKKDGIGSKGGVRQVKGGGLLSYAYDSLAKPTAYLLCCHHSNLCMLHVSCYINRLAEEGRKKEKNKRISGITGRDVPPHIY